MPVTAQQALAVLSEADLLYTPEQVLAAYDRMAQAIAARIAGEDPLVLCVMTGGLIPTGMLLQRFEFPLQLDYLHASRYRGETSGGDLHWIAHPQTSLQGRCVLVIDDILDEGHTLAAILDYCRKESARQVLSAVLVDKHHDRKAEVTPDFIGLEVEDRYVFGCGMDYKGYFRNLPAIYAVREGTL